MGGGTVEYGLTLTCYNVATFFGSLVVGAFSDAFGRKVCFFYFETIIVKIIIFKENTYYVFMWYLYI